MLNILTCAPFLWLCDRCLPAFLLQKRQFLVNFNASLFSSRRQAELNSAPSDIHCKPWIAKRRTKKRSVYEAGMW